MVKPHWIADSFHYESIHDKWTLVLMQRLSSILIHFHELMVPSNNLLLMLCGHVNFSVRCALSVRWDIAQQTSLGDIRLIIQNRNIDLKGAWKHSGPCWRERKKRRHLLDHLPTPHTRLLFFFAPLVTKWFQRHVDIHPYPPSTDISPPEMDGSFWSLIG